MTSNRSRSGFIVACAMGGFATLAGAQVLGQHHLTWWDDAALGVSVTLQGAPPPTPNAIALFNLDEWHLTQAATTNWYLGLPVANLPVNPFNGANRMGMTPGSLIPAVGGAEGFIYQITNVNYFNGNGPPPFQAPPFSFTTPPAGLGQNDLSGINIRDTHGALGISGIAPGSQFMFSANLVVGTVLDLTPGTLGIPASQDWDFNAYTGPGNWEWDIDTAGIGASIGIGPIVFGFAMPGNWQDARNAGHVHSWNMPIGAPPFQVNIAGSIDGFSGPLPSPAGAMVLLGLGCLVGRRSRRGF